MDEPQDAEKIGVRDNEWIEAKNRNGTVSARAVCLPTASRRHGVHAPRPDRQINTPLNEESGKRGVRTTRLTRIFIKPTHLPAATRSSPTRSTTTVPPAITATRSRVIRRRSQEVQF